VEPRLAPVAPVEDTGSVIGMNRRRNTEKLRRGAAYPRETRASDRKVTWLTLIPPLSPVRAGERGKIRDSLAINASVR